MRKFKRKFRKIWAEDDTKAGVALIAFGLMLFAGTLLTRGPLNNALMVGLSVVATVLDMVPAAIGVIMIGQGIRHARERVHEPQVKFEANDEPRPRRQFCEDCGKPYVESSANYGFNQQTGEVQVVQAQHCPDWAGPPDEPGSCGNRMPLTWTNPKPVLTPHHSKPNHPPGEQPNCPGCLWELVHNGIISQDEADGLAQVFLH